MSLNAHANPLKVKTGTSAPKFQGIDFDNNPFDLNDYYGKKPIIINFFSVRCVSCLTVVKMLEGYKSANSIDDEILFVYISLDDWKTEVHVPGVWKEVFNKNQLRINDGKRSIGKLYEIDTLPATLVIDKSGKIIYRRDDYNLDFNKEITNILNTLIK